MTENEIGETPSAVDRRDADRMKLIVDVRYEGGDGTGIANTRDIGVGGLYMTTSANLDIGTPVVMTMSLGGGEIRLQGVVVYTDPGQGVGVRFKDLESTDLERLQTELDLK